MAVVNWSLQHFSDTAANMTANNPVLLEGQIGIETDGLTTTPKFKIGDGSTAWNTLPYFYGGASSAQNLNNVLGVGRTTGGNNMTLTDGDKLFIGSSENRHIEFDNLGIELHNATSSAIVSVTDTGYFKVNAIQNMPALTASRILSLDANKDVVSSYTTNGSGTSLVLSTSPTITTPTFSGFTSFSSSGIPVTNEPNDFRWTVTGSTLLSGNNYGIRSSVDYDSTQNNSSWRLGAILGTYQVKAADTGTLGWGVGVYGSSVNYGAGTVTRGIAGYFVAINNGSVATTNQFGVYSQTEVLSGSTTNNYGLFVRTPIFTGGTLTNNYGLYIEDQQQGTNKWAIYSAGASDLSYFAGNLTVNGTLTGTTSIVGTTNVITPLIVGGSGAGSLITYKSSSGNATGTTTAHLFTGGNNGGTTILTMLNNGTIRIPNNRTIQGTDSAGTQRTLLNWSGGDNISILGRPGITDVTINPTNGGVGLYVKGSNGSTGIGVASPTSYCHLRAGTASANTSPLKFTTGTNLTTAEAGAMEYNNTFHLTNSDATRRHIVLAPNNTKVTAAAPYTNDGYVVINIGGTDFKVMTTA